MFDFKEAFSAGLIEAKDAERAEAEILEVLNNLETQILEATNGKIKITLKSTEGRGPISAVNTEMDPSPIKALANFYFAPEGYPCSLIVGQTQTYCEDKEGLEQSLHDMLTDTSVAKKLYGLMNL